MNAKTTFHVLQIAVVGGGCAALLLLSMPQLARAGNLWQQLRLLPHEECTPDGLNTSTQLAIAAQDCTKTETLSTLRVTAPSSVQDESQKQISSISTTVRKDSVSTLPACRRPE